MRCKVQFTIKVKLFPKKTNKNQFFATFRHIINTFLLMYQIGACCVYVVFIADNIKALVDHAFETEVDNRLIMVIILIPLILINWVNMIFFFVSMIFCFNIIVILLFVRTYRAKFNRYKFK